MLALLAAGATLGSFKLGLGNLVAGVGIAAVKAALAAWIFMSPDRASSLIRALVGACVVLLILTCLSLVDLVARQGGAVASSAAGADLAPARPATSAAITRLA